MKRLIIILVVLILAYPLAAQIGTHALLRLFPHTFADIHEADMPDHGAITDGQVTYCSDCTIPATPGAVCTPGGPGAEAHRIRGKWLCF
jgi:hypothetical protein